MNKKFYDVGIFLYLREQKCTTGLIVGAAVTAAAGIASSAINASSQSSANAANMQLNKDTLNEQKMLFREANQFNHDEALINRNFNAEQAALGRDFNSAEAEKNRQFQAGMVEKYMDYTSAKNQVARALEGGQNPATLAGRLGDGGFSIPSGALASASSASSSPASAAGVPNLPTAHLNPVNYGDFAKVLGEAVNTGLSATGGSQAVTEKEIELKYKDALQAAGLNIKQQEARVLSKQYYQIIEEIDQARANTNLINEKIGLVEMQGNYYDIMGEKVKAEKVSQEIENFWKNDFMAQTVKQARLDNNLKELEAKYYVAVVQASIAEKFGIAEQARANANLLSVEKEFKVKNMETELQQCKEVRNYYENENDILRVEKGVVSATANKRAEEQIKALEYENSYWMRGAKFMKEITTPVATALGFYLVGRKGAPTAPTTFKGATIQTTSPYNPFNPLGR